MSKIIKLKNKLLWGGGGVCDLYIYKVLGIIRSNMVY